LTALFVVENFSQTTGFDHSFDSLEAQDLGKSLCKTDTQTCGERLPAIVKKIVQVLEARVGAKNSAFVTVRALLRIELIRRNAKHVITLNAYAV
jgi:hypothetical protein